MLIFVAALQSPEVSADWTRVSKLCDRTLRSMCGQSNSDFRVILVCNRAPLGDYSHPNLDIIEEPFAIPANDTGSRMNDKWLKLKRGLIAARQYAPAHIMIADADDCVHRDLAAFAARSPISQGWQFDKGFIYDEGSRWLFRSSGFDRLCGSSAIVRLEEHDFPQAMSDPIDPYFILCNGHGVIADYMRDRGTPLEPLPFPGAVYVTATGENDSQMALRNWRGKRMMLRKLMRSRLLTRRMRRLYGITELH